MKIEMGESLFYSWLRHVKECQLVQTNWKSSPSWTFESSNVIEEMLGELDSYFREKSGDAIFKKNGSLSQIIQQGECDVLGIHINTENVAEGYIKNTYYAVDVAFHTSGLNYGSKKETILKVVSKCVRTAFCLYGYFGAKEAEIVFASPEIKPAVLEELLPMIDYINAYFKSKGFGFEFRIICNEEFKTLVVDPVLALGGDVADTSELFMRSYQLIRMFYDVIDTPKKATKKSKGSVSVLKVTPIAPTVIGCYEMKVGAIAKNILRDFLEKGTLLPAEIDFLQDASYSKRNFDLNFPLLIEDGKSFEEKRYYKEPVEINKKKYYITSQWFDRSKNQLINWLKAHKAIL